MPPDRSVSCAGRRSLVDPAAHCAVAVPAGDVEAGEVGYGNVAAAAAIERVGQGDDYWNCAWVTRGDVRVQAPVVGRANTARHESIVHPLPHLADLLPGADEGAIGRNSRVWARLARVSFVGICAAADDVGIEVGSAAVDRSAVAAVRADELQDLRGIRCVGGDSEIPEGADADTEIRRRPVRNGVPEAAGAARALAHLHVRDRGG